MSVHNEIRLVQRCTLEDMGFANIGKREVTFFQGYVVDSPYKRIATDNPIRRFIGPKFLILLKEH